MRAVHDCKGEEEGHNLVGEEHKDNQIRLVGGQAVEEKLRLDWRVGKYINAETGRTHLQVRW